ncbi:aminotransferase-like domain-containing protein [Streptomyces griseosporeus]|uniref:aminotransferase-like domain-containing protein n=1 Tax=Streptomyces griseosporeus TaxID=1910 RepID=UPI00167E6F79|nr:PLP-dependent aminotransferase family protein [Streptomyces griseosporeus]
MSTRSTQQSAEGRPEPVGHGSDFLQLDIRDVPDDGKADWLAARLRQAIADGRVAVGSRLPPTRILAAELRLSRGVVTEAYRRLAEDGQVEGRRRGGTVVVAAPFTATGPAARPLPSPAPTERARKAVLPPARQEPPAPLTDDPHDGRPLTDLPRPAQAAWPAEATRAAHFAPPPSPAPPTTTPTPFSSAPTPAVFDALRATPATADFTPGRPDLAAFPRAAWLRAERAVLGGLSAEHLGYGDPRGAPALRRAVAGWVARNRGVRVAPDEVLIVSGTAQALTLLHPVLRAEGLDAVAVEDPGSLGSRQHLQAGGLATPAVPVDEDGVRVDALRATGARAVLLTPAHQFPTGVVTSGERRRELLAWAREGGLILEDDYDAEHRYDRPPVPALRGLLADQVCYLGSVSKLLAPALRIGWMVPPPRHRVPLTDAKRFADLGNAVLPQLVLARLMDSGELERHLRTVRRRHRGRRDAMITALAAHLPGAVVHGASAGLHLTVTYDADVPDTDLAAAALARGVKCHPLSWHRQVPGRPGLVLGYAGSPPGVIAEGVAALGEALRELTR